MTTVEEIVERGPRNAAESRLTIPPLFSRTAQPMSRDEIGELAKHLAHSVVIGFMEHDKGYTEHDRSHLDKSVEAFFEVFSHLFTKVSSLRARRAAELYVEALVKHDEVENALGHSREQIIEDPEWAEVRRILLEFSRTLGLPDSYADEATTYWKYHGVRDSRYVIHCLESENILLTEAIGNSYWSKILGSLFVLLIECHDKHDPTGLEAGLDFATKYYEIILRAKSAVSQKTSTVSA